MNRNPQMQYNQSLGVLNCSFSNQNIDNSASILSNGAINNSSQIGEPGYTPRQSRNDAVHHNTIDQHNYASSY